MSKLFIEESTFFICVGLIFVFLIVFAENTAMAQKFETNREQAKAAFQQGQKFFNKEKFKDAKKAYERSLKALAHYTTIFNIALCEEKLGMTRQAIERYQQYLNWPSEVPSRAEVEKKLKKLKAKLPKRSITSINQPSVNTKIDDTKNKTNDNGQSRDNNTDAKNDHNITDNGKTNDNYENGESESADNDGSKVAGLLISGAGVAALAVGGIMLGKAAQKKEEMDSIKTEPYQQTIHDTIREDGLRFEKIGWIVGGAGAVTLTTGLIMIIISARSKKDTNENETAKKDSESVVKLGASICARGFNFNLRWGFDAYIN